MPLPKHPALVQLSANSLFRLTLDLTSSPHPHRIQPGLVVPPPIGMADPNSFAFYTWKTRWPAVVQGVSADPRYGESVRQRLNALLQEMEVGTVWACPDIHGPDLEDWRLVLEPYRDRPWIELPWFFAEVYFYRRLLAATHYFHPNEYQNLDPFESSKLASLHDHRSTLRSLVAAFAELREFDWPTGLREGWSRMLWGNQADLSLRPGERLDLAASSEHHLLVNQMEQAIAHIQAHRPLHRVDLIADNAGIELITDLAWIDFMLTADLAQTVHLHLKAQPTFVSDATPADLDTVLHHLDADSDPNLHRLGSRLQESIASNRLQVAADPVWTTPCVFWEMPDPLHHDLATSDLLIFKGDANYRRILGDRQWDTTVDFAAIAQYLPAPSLALRTLKSEIIVGLAPGQTEAIAAQDPDWHTNGQWSIVQYLDRKPAVASQ